jgi:hypothetical protein
MVRASRVSLLLALLSLAVALPLHAKDDWLPITPADLQYKDPGGANAVILYLQSDTDDEISVESVYVREKILTEEGKKNADVELPYLKNFSRIDDIKGRVIQQDGSISNFDGKIYDKVIVKSKTVKIQVRAFTLPAVQIGSVIEYRYKLRWDGGWLLSTTWDVQRDLLVKKAHFTLKPYTGPTNVPLRLSWVFIGLPNSIQPKKVGALYVLDMTDIPPHPDEQYSPPERWSKMVVRFLYSSDEDITRGPDEFWRRKAINWNESAEQYVGRHKAVDQEVATLVLPSDAPEVKLRKLYARAQQIRNTSYEREKTEKEAKHDKQNDNNNVDDVLKHGYGTRPEINLLMLAMARSAGLDASYVRAAPRDVTIFTKSILDIGQLSSVITRVKLADKDMFLDPGTLYCPFGMLRWELTGVTALNMNKNGGEFITTTSPHSADAITLRDGTLRLSEGKLEGTVKVTFKGLEALRWKTNEREEDDAEKRKDLEKELAGWLPTGAEIELTKVTGWTSTDDPLVAEFKVSVIGAVTSTSKRLLMATGVFQSNDSHPFKHPERKLPVYYSYPYREIDDITIELPAGYQLEGSPKPQTVKTDFAVYQRMASADGSKVHMQRRFVMEGFLFMPRFYADIRSFYDAVRAGDEETLVMKAGAQ